MAVSNPATAARNVRRQLGVQESLPTLHAQYAKSFILVSCVLCGLVNLMHVCCHYTAPRPRLWPITSPTTLAQCQCWNQGDVLQHRQDSVPLTFRVFSFHRTFCSRPCAAPVHGPEPSPKPHAVAQGSPQKSKAGNASWDTGRLAAARCVRGCGWGKAHRKDDLRAGGP